MRGDCQKCGQPLGYYAVGFRDGNDFKWYHNMCGPAVTR